MDRPHPSSPGPRRVELTHGGAPWAGLKGGSTKREHLGEQHATLHIGLCGPVPARERAGTLSRGTCEVSGALSRSRSRGWRPTPC